MSKDLFAGRPVIPVIEIEDPESAVPLAEALLAGGMDIIEVTFRTAAGAEAIGRIAKDCPDMVVGASTVVTADQARRALDLGVHFGVAPGLNPATVEIFKNAGVPFLPGVVTRRRSSRGPGSAAPCSSFSQPAPWAGCRH